MRRNDRKQLRRAPVGLERLERRDLLSSLSFSSTFGNPDDRTASAITTQVSTASAIGNPELRTVIVAI
jgi:hypothetical protein